jgi:hypothetical protein
VILVYNAHSGEVEILAVMRDRPRILREICGNQLCSVVLRRANVQRAPLGKLLNLRITSSRGPRS